MYNTLLGKLIMQTSSINVHDVACYNTLKEKPPLRAYVSRAKCLIPVDTVVPPRVHWVSECCGNIVEVFLKLIKTLKAEHCLNV